MARILVMIKPIKQTESRIKGKGGLGKKMSIAVKELKNKEKLKFQVQGELGSDRENKQRCENKIHGPCLPLCQTLVLTCCEHLANPALSHTEPLAK